MVEPISDARSHRAPARACRRGVTRRPTSVTVRAARRRSGSRSSRSRATSRRRRRFSSRRRSCRDRRSRCTGSGSTRGERASSTSSSAWARGSRSTTGGLIGGEPAGDVEVRASELVGATVTRRRGARRSSTSCRSSRSPRATRAARPWCAARRSSARRSRTGSKASWRSCRRIGGHIRATRDGFRVRGVPARLRGGIVDSRGDHRLAMLGAVAGVASREGVELRGAEAVGSELPGLLRGAASRSRRARFITLPRHDRGHRRAGRLGEEHRRVDARASVSDFGYLDTGAMYRALTWLARRDGVGRRRRIAARARLARRAPGLVRRRRPGGDRRRGRDDRDPRCRDRPSRADGRASSGGARGHARPAARSRRRSATPSSRVATSAASSHRRPR